MRAGTGWRRPSTRRLVVCALVAALVVSLATVAYLYWLRDPDRIHVFGRDYGRGSPQLVTLARADDRPDGPLTVVRCLPVIGRCHRVAGPTPGADVPTVILLEHGSRYTEYALEGGP